MRVWLKAAPCLTCASTFGLGLSSSVVLSFSGEVLADFFLFFFLFLFHTCIIKWFAAFPALLRINGIAPYCILAIGVSAIVVLAKAFVWKLRRSCFMRVGLKAAPCLARASTFGLGLLSSVVLSCSGEVLADFFLFFFLFLYHTCIIKWFAAFPAVFWINGIAPDCILAIGVSAIIVLAEAFVWEL